MAAKFAVDIEGYGVPRLKGWVITVPVILRFNNPSPVPITVTRLLATTSVLKNGQWIQAGHLDQPVNIPSGVSNQTFSASVDLQSIFGGNILNTFTAITDALKSKSVRLRTDVTAYYGDVSLPVQSFENEITL